MWPLPLTILILVVSSSLDARPASAASSIIAAGRPLVGGDTMPSERGNFVLGFFAPGESRNFYLGIWYSKIQRRTVVWVANRETPLRDPSSSEVRISADGNLVLFSRSETPVWSTNTSSMDSNSTVAELLDTGNLVLRDGHNSSRVFWQSFDHPTDTWLPGGKLGRNKLTGEAQKIISWRNSHDPSPGIFSLEVDPEGSSQYFIVWNSSVRYWTSGYWDGQTFTNIPEMVPDYIYSFEYVSNAREDYFTYSSIDTGLISRLLVDPSGQIKQLTWVDDSQGWMQFWSEPKAQCDVYRRCGPFGVCDEGRFPYCSCVKGFQETSSENWALGDVSGGCRRRTPSQCEGRTQIRTEHDRFDAMSRMKPPEGPRPSAAKSAGECEAACLSNCSCTAYSYDGRGCSLWYDALFNLRQLPDGSPDGGTVVYLRLAASELPTQKSNNKNTVGIAVGAAAAVLVASAVVSVVMWGRRRRQLRRLHLTEGSLVAFSYSELKRVTKNFSEKLGAGGFGSVFRGTMPDSTLVAVKKLEGVGQGEKQFRTEVSTMGTIQHVNLVRLRGFCSERSRRLLVYDFMPRGSLDHVLFQDSTTGAAVPSWKTRYQIILGTARGLAYLHEKCRDCIIHCDIKPENILLDAALAPKVADFGLAKLVGRDFSRVLTTMRGTRGYLAPEWIYGLPITAKADVYSYGMTLFEIISGRRNSVEEEEGEKFTFFPSWAASKLMRGEVMGLLDPRLGDDADLEELNRVFRVAYWCVQDQETSRPAMGQVVQILEGVLDVGMPPIPRFLLSLSKNMGTVLFFSGVSPNQISRVPTSDVSTSSQNQSSTSSASNY